MNTIRKKITVVISVILISVLGLMTICTLISSNKHFTVLLLQTTGQNQESNVTAVRIPEGHLEEQGVDTQLMQNQTIKESEQSFITGQFVVMLLLASAGIFFVYFWLGKVLKPLSVLNQAALKVDAHNWDAQIPVPNSKDEVATLTRSFNSMIERLEGVFTQQKAFAQSAAHELKTPLSVMKSSIQVLYLDGSPTIEDYQECTLSISQSVDDLIEIVNQLLLLTNTDEFEIKATDISKIIDECIAEYKQDCEEKGIRISCQCDNLLIKTNPVLLTGAIRNLLTNAIKYNKSDGEIYIRVGIYEQSAEIQVEDTGIGICSEHLPYIFQPFYREDTSRSKQIPGNGLGLSIVKSIVEKLNGTIDVTSAIGIGTVFTIRLPL